MPAYATQLRAAPDLHLHSIYAGATEPIGTAALLAEIAIGGELADLLVLADIEDEFADLLMAPATRGDWFIEQRRLAAYEYLPLMQQLDMLLHARFGSCLLQLDTCRPLTDRELALAKLDYLRGALTHSLRPVLN